MKAKLIFLIAALFPPSLVMADPLAGGDVKIGKALVEKNCIACHARLYPGDGKIAGANCLLQYTNRYAMVS